MSSKRKRSVSPNSKHESQSAGTTIFRSEEITDRQSTFIGYYSPTIQPKELQKLAEFEQADHKILAWRRESNQQSLTSAKKYVAGYDDDGEKFAGKKVEQALTNADVTGACVVARYWGGVMLGPVRFQHIEACAAGAIKKWQDSVLEETRKKQKVEFDTREAQRLVKVLTARDQSINVLRTLATDKEARLKALKAKTEDGPEKPTGSQTAAAVVYDGMPLQRLQALEKARDATLGFLLKRIDKAEAELKQTEAGKEPNG